LKLAARFKQRQNLGRFADAHVVSQTAPKREPAQEVHPTETLALIIPQLANESGRLLGGSDALKLP
jgi:hypothetical protein